VGRGEFDAPKESLSTAVRRLSRGGALRITGIDRTIRTPHRYTSRKVLLNPVDAPIPCVAADARRARRRFDPYVVAGFDGHEMAVIEGQNLVRRRLATSPPSGADHEDVDERGAF